MLVREVSLARLSMVSVRVGDIVGWCPLLSMMVPVCAIDGVFLC